MRYAPRIALCCSFSLLACLPGCTNEERDQKAAAASQIDSVMSAARKAVTSEGSSADRAAQLRAALAPLDSFGGSDDLRGPASLLASSLRTEAAALELADARAATSIGRADAEKARWMARRANELMAAATVAREIEADQLGPNLDAVRVEAERIERTSSESAEQFTAEAAQLESDSAAYREQANAWTEEAARLWSEARNQTPLASVALIDQAGLAGDESRRGAIACAFTESVAELKRSAGSLEQGAAEGHARIAEAAVKARHSLEGLVTRMREAGATNREAAHAAVSAVSGIVDGLLKVEETIINESLERATTDLSEAVAKAQGAMTGSLSSSASLAEATAHASAVQVWMIRQSVAAQQESLLRSMAEMTAFEGGSNWSTRAVAAAGRAEQAKGKAIESVELALQSIGGIAGEPGVTQLQISLDRLKTMLTTGTSPAAASANAESDVTADSSPDVASTDAQPSSAGQDHYFTAGAGADSPEAIVEVLNRMAAGDGAALNEFLGLLGAAQASDASMVTPIVGILRSMGPLMQALQAKFGADSSGASAAGSLPLSSLGDASVSSKDESTAIISCKGPAETRDLGCFTAEGKWYIDTPSLLGEAEQAQVQQMGAMLNMAGAGLATAANETAKRVNAGEFADSQSAMAAFSAAMQAEIMKKMGQGQPRP